MTEQRTGSVLALNADESARAREQYEAMKTWLLPEPAAKSTKNPHATRGRRRDVRSLGSQDV